MPTITIELSETELSPNRDTLRNQIAAQIEACELEVWRMKMPIGYRGPKTEQETAADILRPVHIDALERAIHANVVKLEALKKKFEEVTGAAPEYIVAGPQLLVHGYYWPGRVVWKEKSREEQSHEEVDISAHTDIPEVPTDQLQLTKLNLEKHKELTLKSIAKEAETKTTSERASAVLEKANRDYLQSCEAAELASKEMVEHIMTQETLQKEVDQLVRERKIQEIQDKIRIQNEVSQRQAQASAQRQSELEAELAAVKLSD